MLRKRWRVLPRLIRFMALNFADGIALGWTGCLLLIRFDFMQIGTLLASHGSPLLTAFFFAQGGLLVGTLTMSVAVMNLGEDD